MTPSDPATHERRAAPRLKPAVGTTCRFDADDDPAVPPTGLVWNISRSGVSMLVPVTPAANAILAGELVREGGGDGLAVLLRVVRTSPVPTGDYMLAGQFLRELTQDELDHFTANT